MCNYYEGEYNPFLFETLKRILHNLQCNVLLINVRWKNDLMRALEFVFGATLTDLNVECSLDLVHKVLREEFLVNRSIQSFVEVTIYSVVESKHLKFWRGMRNGSHSVRIEHKISDIITSNTIYEEKLSSLNLYVKQTNLIFYKDYFNNAIWGSSEDLERIIFKCLRETYMLDDWKKATKEVKNLSELRQRTAEKNYNSIKKSHNVIAEYADNYEAIVSYRERSRNQIFADILDSDSEENSISPITEEHTVALTEEPEDKFSKIIGLETKINLLTQKLNELKLREGFLKGSLYHEEIKLAIKPVNFSILQNRISEIKTNIREKENQLSIIWEEIVKLKFELQNLSLQIPNVILSLNDIQVSKQLQNRFTTYGRFMDYLKPSPYLQLLRRILGNEIFYANLCDSMETASGFLNLLRIIKYEHRESFIAFDNYSHKLKDVIIASGEKGIKISTLEELLIFLCKLKHYALIEKVPAIVQNEVTFDDVMSTPLDYIVYLQNGLHFTNDGLICYYHDGDTFCLDTEVELEKKVIHLEIEQETKFQEWRDLLFQKWETLAEMNSLENDIFYLKQKWKKTRQAPHTVPESPPITDIYNDFKEIFNQCAEDWQKLEGELQQTEEQFFVTLEQENTSISGTSSEEWVNLLSKDLEEVILEKKEIQKLLTALTRELSLQYTVSPQNVQFQKQFFKFDYLSEKSKFFYEKEFKKLKKLMTQDDLEDFLGCLEWRSKLITSLIKELDAIKNKLKTSKEVLKTVAIERKKKLNHLLEHCNRYLSSTFSHLMGNALPFLELGLNTKEENLQLMSCLGEDKVNVVDIKHFNTFLKFIGVLSLFLEISVFEKIPVIIFDDMEEYFPWHDDSAETLLHESTIKQIFPETDNFSFQLLMRTGQYLKHFIKKHVSSNLVRSNVNEKDINTGPTQVIYFTKDNLINAGEKCIWICNQILPDEYIREDCDSYSEIHEIDIENLV